MLKQAPPQLLTLRQRRAQVRRNAAGLVADCRKRFDAGELGALLEAINWCAGGGIPIPRWAADAFQQKFRATVWAFKHRSWDAVFGKPNRGKNIHAAKKAKDLSLAVYLMVQELRAKRPKPRGIYQTVATKLRISTARETKRYFENFRKFYFK
jgi:hypothetical protein